MLTASKHFGLNRDSAKTQTPRTHSESPDRKPTIRRSPIRIKRSTSILKTRFPMPIGAWFRKRKTIWQAPWPISTRRSGSIPEWPPSSATTVCREVFRCGAEAPSKPITPPIFPSDDPELDPAFARAHSTVARSLHLSIDRLFRREAAPVCARLRSTDPPDSGWGFGGAEHL